MSFDSRHAIIVVVAAAAAADDALYYVRDKNAVKRFSIRDRPLVRWVVHVFAERE
jgi:hypothetical protein